MKDIIWCGGDGKYLPTHGIMKNGTKFPVSDALATSLISQGDAKAAAKPTTKKETS